MPARALIDPNGVTQNIILVDIDGAYPLQPGWTLGDPVTNPLPDPTPGVPQAVSPRQLKLALLANGQLDQVNSFVAAQSQEVQISWNDATEFERTNALLEQMAVAFGMTDAQMDALFQTAITL